MQLLLVHNPLLHPTSSTYSGALKRASLLTEVQSCYCWRSCSTDGFLPCSLVRHRELLPELLFSRRSAEVLQFHQSFTAPQHCCCVSQHCVLAALGSVLLSVLPAGPAQSGILTDREVVSLFLHFTVNPKPRVEFIDRPRCCLRGKECSISRFQQVESRWGYSGTSDRIRSASLLVLLPIDSCFPSFPPHTRRAVCQALLPAAGQSSRVLLGAVHAAAGCCLLLSARAASSALLGRLL